MTSIEQIKKCDYSSLSFFHCVSVHMIHICVCVHTYSFFHFIKVNAKEHLELQLFVNIESKLPNFQTL